MAGRDEREGHGVLVRGVGNLACSPVGNFANFLIFDAKSNVLRVGKLNVKVRSLTHSYWDG